MNLSRIKIQLTCSWSIVATAGLPVLGTLLITVLRRRYDLLLGSLLVGLVLVRCDPLHVSLLLGLSSHLLCGSRVLLLVVQHLKKLLLLLPRGCCALQIKT
jgi:hypothetical protein